MLQSVEMAIVNFTEQNIDVEFCCDDIKYTAIKTNGQQSGYVDRLNPGHILRLSPHYFNSPFVKVVDEDKDGAKFEELLTNEYREYRGVVKSIFCVGVRVQWTKVSSMETETTPPKTFFFGDEVKELQVQTGKVWDWQRRMGEPFYIDEPESYESLSEEEWRQRQIQNYDTEATSKSGLSRKRKTASSGKSSSKRRKGDKIDQKGPVQVRIVRSDGLLNVYWHKAKKLETRIPLKSVRPSMDTNVPYVPGTHLNGKKLANDESADYGVVKDFDVKAAKCSVDWMKGDKLLETAVESAYDTNSKTLLDKIMTLDENGDKSGIIKDVLLNGDILIKWTDGSETKHKFHQLKEAANERTGELVDRPLDSLKPLQEWKLLFQNKPNLIRKELNKLLRGAESVLNLTQEREEVIAKHTYSHHEPASFGRGLEMFFLPLMPCDRVETWKHDDGRDFGIVQRVNSEKDIVINWYKKCWTSRVRIGSCKAGILTIVAL